MRAAVMRGQSLVVEDLPDPVPGPGQVVAKTLACGICGSDLHMLKFSHRMVELGQRGGIPILVEEPDGFVMGHEFCAEILEHGPDSPRTLKPGTRVCSVPIIAGADGIQSVGYSRAAPGGYGEAMLLTEALLLEVPNGLSSEHAALTEPMAVGLHAVEMARLEGRELPVVIGCGPVGLSVISMLKRRGAGPIVASDFSPARRALAEALGADEVVDPAVRSPYTSWQELVSAQARESSDPGAALGAQAAPAVIFECVGVPGVVQQILEGAPRGVRVVVVGACMETDHIEPAIAMMKEVNLQFVLGYRPHEFEATLRAIAEGEVNVAPLVTGKVGVAEVATAFEQLKDPEKHAKILIEPWR